MSGENLVKFYLLVGVRDRAPLRLYSVLNIIPCQGRVIEYSSTIYFVLWRSIA